MSHQDKEQEPSAPLVIQCPNPECGTAELRHIGLIELEPVMWPFRVEGDMIIANSRLHSSDNFEPIEDTRHLFCCLCATEWKVPTVAKVSWE